MKLFLTVGLLILHNAPQSYCFFGDWPFFFERKREKEVNSCVFVPKKWCFLARGSTEKHASCMRGVCTQIECGRHGARKKVAAGPDDGGGLLRICWGRRWFMVLSGGCGYYTMYNTATITQASADIVRICLNILVWYTFAWEQIDWQGVVKGTYVVEVYIRIYLFSYARCKMAQKWLVLWILWRTCNLADENKGFILAEIAIRAKRGTGGSKNNVTLWRY